MGLTGTYVPSSVGWVRDEVAHYEQHGRGVDGRAVVVLHTLGARTGALRKTPLMRVAAGGAWAVVASAAGAEVAPSWYANLLADPRCALQDGGVVHDLVARELCGAERTAWWNRACVAFPSYADYQRRTRRRIPVLLLEAA